MAKKVQKGGTGLGTGIAVAASLAAAAGAFFIYGTKEGVKTKKKIKSWSLKAKAEVLEKLEKMKDISEESYKNAVSQVVKKYDKLKAEHGDEVDTFVKELNGYWNHIRKQISPKKKSTKKK